MTTGDTRPGEERPECGAYGNEGYCRCGVFRCVETWPVPVAAPPDWRAVIERVQAEAFAAGAAVRPVVSPGDDLGALRAAVERWLTGHEYERMEAEGEVAAMLGYEWTDEGQGGWVRADLRAALEARPASDAGEPDPLLGMRLAKCPHCGEELSVWPAALDAAGASEVRIPTADELRDQ